MTQVTTERLNSTGTLQLTNLDTGVETYKVYHSYDTPIALERGEISVILDQRFSMTTSHHVSRLLGQFRNSPERVRPDIFKALLGIFEHDTRQSIRRGRLQ